MADLKRAVVAFMPDDAEVIGTQVAGPPEQTAFGSDVRHLIPCSMAPNWQRKFARPIRLADGTVFRTLRDAADWIIEHNPPGTTKAIERLMDAAEKGGSVKEAETTIRIALFMRLDFEKE